MKWWPYASASIAAYANHVRNDAWDTPRLARFGMCTRRRCGKPRTHVVKWPYGAIDYTLHDATRTRGRSFVCVDCAHKIYTYQRSTTPPTKVRIYRCRS